MLNRRGFLAGACCLFHAGPALAKPRPRASFICTASVEDEAPVAEKAPPAEPTVRTVVVDGREFKIVEEQLPLVRATMYGPERWLPEHGSTPASGVVTLSIHFIGGTASQRDQVRRVAPEWLRGGLEKKIRFVFGVSRDRSQIRISFDRTRTSQSSVGARARNVPPTQPTMNLAEVSQRVILHEFGHALGLRHEQHHPDVHIDWDRDAVLADLKSRELKDFEAWAENNVFTRFPQSHSCSGSAFDRKSVMLYPVDKAWTRNGFSSSFNDNISRGDRSCLAKVYGA